MFPKFGKRFHEFLSASNDAKDFLQEIRKTKTIYILVEIDIYTRITEKAGSARGLKGNKTE